MNSDIKETIVDKAKAREIIQVVLNHGINQAQIYHMIYLLALELENIDHMKLITKIITKNHNKKSTLLTGEENE